MKQLVALLAITLLSVTAMAESKPVNFSLTPDVALFSREFLIKGLTLSFWGENEQQSLALGIVNGTPGDSAGAAGAIMVNYADYYTGVRGAGVNYSAQDTLGWDGALVNYTERLFTGLLSGIVNVAGQLRGVELGIFNYVDEADQGFQAGLINVIANNETWFSNFPDELAPVMPFVNWHFHESAR